MKNRYIQISIVLIASFVSSCSKSDFAAGGANNSKNSSNGTPGDGSGANPGGPGGTNGPGGVGNPSDPNNPGGSLGTGDGSVAINEAVKCSEGLVSFIGIGGVAQCPANSTAYAVDDGNPWMACCALPKGDIFLTSVQPTIRGNECGDDEMIIGLQGSSMICQKIDTTKYQLTSPGNACYFGKGAAGKSGAGKCTVPSKTLTAIGTKFGSDGCIAPPGGVVHGRKGGNCGDIPIRILQTVGGAAVAFPY